MIFVLWKFSLHLNNMFGYYLFEFLGIGHRLVNQLTNLAALRLIILSSPFFLNYQIFNWNFDLRKFSLFKVNLWVYVYYVHL